MANLLRNLPTLASAALFGAILIAAFRAGSGTSRYRIGFLITGTSGLAWACLKAFEAFGPADFQPVAYFPIGYAALLSLSSLAFQAQVRIFLKKPGMARPVWAGVLAWTAFLVLLAISPGPISEAGFSAPRNDLLLGLVLFAWALVTLDNFRILALEYRRARQPLHRNRIAYWVLTNLAGALAGFSLAWGLSGTALAFAAAGAGAVAAIAGRAELPDLRGGSLRLMTVVIKSGLLLLVYGLSYLLAFYLVQVRWGQSAVLAGLTMALGLVLAMQPLFSRLDASILAWLGEEPADPPSLVRDFTLATANILDPQQLAQTVLRCVTEAMDTQTGAFFMVTRTKVRKAPHFVLTPVHAQPLQPLFHQGEIPARSPLGKYFSRQMRPITQFAIDQLAEPDPQQPSGQDWFAGLELDVHAPVRVQDRWVAMISLGPKETGLAYSEAELNLLQRLAGQLAGVLRNILAVQEIQEERKSVESVISNLARSHQELKRLERARSDFIQLASHELRNPLSVVYGYAQMLEDAPALRENQQFRTLIGGLHHSSEQLGLIADNLLDVAQIDHYTIALDPLPLPLPAVLASLKHRFETICSQRDLILDIDDMQGLPPVDIDRESIQKVFYNLLANSVRHTPPGGRIRISGSFLAASGTSAGEDCIRLTVEDTRAGIGAEPQKSLYPAAAKSSQSGARTTLAPHAGEIGPELAIAIAKRVVESHGGRIWIESPGRRDEDFPGSRFHLLLPVRQARKTAPA